MLARLGGIEVDPDTILDRVGLLDRSKDWLGFAVDWEHRFEPGLPLYMQVSRDGIQFHISEHHGDGSPGAHVRVNITDVTALHAELIDKHYKNNRPQLDRPEWGGTEFTVVDPVNNCIIFAEADQVWLIRGAIRSHSESLKKSGSVG